MLKVILKLRLSTMIFAQKRKHSQAKTKLCVKEAIQHYSNYYQLSTAACTRVRSFSQSIHKIHHFYHHYYYCYSYYFPITSKYIIISTSHHVLYHMKCFICDSFMLVHCTVGQSFCLWNGLRNRSLCFVNVLLYLSSF